MSTSSQTPFALSATPAFKTLAMAIDQRIPSERASDYLYDFRTVVRGLTLTEVRSRLLGTTDGGEVDPGFEIPAGEIARILDELSGGVR